ncbi:hypothetical protein [Arthrobacter sp. BE255]|uniref:hypothetical protein n=1 Tax=Arthrobacter sp. BE255 TaxID=2817721 RepID=UPI002867160B|nr:hypothetical protein [Arthrobacter sp. BE255]MDR7160138.1 hypothetical protein [Arthrobacter sp. BE255]
MTSHYTFPSVQQQWPGAQPPYRLTATWKLIIASAAVFGVGTCVALGFLWAAMFVTQPGSLEVLDRAPVDQDMPVSDYASLEDARMEGARFLGTYGNSNYYAAPSTYDRNSFCLITEAVADDGVWEATCNRLIDGRDVVTSISDLEGRWVILVPDQFDHGELEAEGWVSVHQNLLVQPRMPAAEERT